MSAEDNKSRISDSLDPTQYAVHVTRTALLLEQLATDVKALRDQVNRVDQDVSHMREDNLRGQGSVVLDRDYRREQAEIGSKFAVLEGGMVVNREAIARLSGTLGWLTKLVIGAVLTGAIGGAITLLFKMGS